MSLIALVPTKDRYFYTLPLTILSILEQSTSVDEILVLDDSIEYTDITTVPMFQCLFEMCKFKHIKFNLIRTMNIGIPMVFKIGLEHAVKNNYDHVWKLDDDYIANTNTVTNYYNTLNSHKSMGAYGTLIHLPNIDDNTKKSGDIAGIFDTITPQIITNKDVLYHNRYMYPEHLYCSFIFRTACKNIVSTDYMLLTKIGNREETIFTYEIFKSGYKLMVDTSLISIHLKVSRGGIRSFEDFSNMYTQDDNILRKMLERDSKT